MIKEKYMPLITMISILLAVSIVITSIVFNNNNSNSVINTQSEYASKLFDKNEVMQINISIDKDTWDNLIENAKEEEFVPCDITVNGETLNSVGIRCKGNSSLNQVASDDTTDRFSFKLDFSEYIDGQNLFGLNAMFLNNMISDPTYMKEYLSYEMMSEMGVNTPDYSYANITLNGENWGLYLAAEPIDENFLTNYYGTDYGNLYKPESTQMGAGGQGDNGGLMKPQENMPDMNEDQEDPLGKNDDFTQGPNGQNIDQGNDDNMKLGMKNMGSGNSGTSLVYSDDNLSSYKGIFDDVVTKSTDDTDKKKVIEMMKNLNDGTNLEKYLDVDEILRYFAVNTFLVNLDSYAGSLKHNYYLYEQDGNFQILPWDFNLSFGSFQMNDASKVINFPIDAPVTDTMENSPLISKLLEVEDYKEQYHSYLQELIQTYITSGKYSSEIEKIDSLIAEYVKNDSTAFYNYEEYKNSLSELKVYGKDRTNSILAQLAGEQSSTSYGDIQTTLDLSAFGSMGKGNMHGEKGQKEEMKKTAENIDQDGLTQFKDFGGRENIDKKFEKNNVSNKILYTNGLEIFAYFSCLVIGIICIFKYKRKKYS